MTMVVCTNPSCGSERHQFGSNAHKSCQVALTEASKKSATSSAATASSYDPFGGKGSTKYSSPTPPAPAKPKKKAKKQPKPTPAPAPTRSVSHLSKGHRGKY